MPIQLTFRNSLNAVNYVTSKVFDYRSEKARAGS